jgi:hypothetical protein
MSIKQHLQYVPESSGVDARVVLFAAVSGLGLLAISIALFYEVYQYAVPVKTVPPPEKFVQPRVITSESEVSELQRLRDQQNGRLETWRWLNDQHTLVQIPIERAMELLAQKGSDAYAALLPPQPALSPPTAAAQNAITPYQPPNSRPVPQEKSP